MVDHFYRLGRYLLAGTAAIALVIMVAVPARTHTHVDGDGTTVSWYPAECCSDGDCRPVASIKPARDGLLMTTVDGYTALVDEAHVRPPSRDLRWHVRIEEYAPEVGPRVRCVFEPPPNS